MGQERDLPIITERELIELEEYIRQIWEFLPIPIAFISPLGIVIDVDDAMEKLLGYTREEMIGRSLFDFCPEEKKMMELQDRTLKGKPATNYEECSLIDAQGKKIAVSISTLMRTDYQSGEPVGYFAAFIDITERKRLVEELRELYEVERKQRQELKEEQEARGQSMQVLAHELRTPLTPLLISAEMLKEILSSKPESYEYRLADLLLSGAKTLGSRLDDLFDIARFTIGAFTIYPEPLDVKALLEDMALRFRPVTDDKKQSLTLDIPQTLPMIEADRSRLEQVIMNLLSNATKFSHEGDNITLRARAGGSELVVEVVDEGVGLSPEELTRIFKPYHRVEQDRQRFSGLGLGLAVSKQIVDAHRGRIWANSELGQGSTFGFSLPVKGEESGG